jgi:aldose 1-epimerase
MTIDRMPFGNIGGAELGLFRISNGHGASLAVTDFGATAVEMQMPAPSGAVADIILGFDSVEAYARSATYCGATVGRFANRLRGGRFMLDGQVYQVPPNEGGNALHGGQDGFHRRTWVAEPDTGANSVRFALVSPDGDEGFPGRLDLTAEYVLADDNTVRITYRAATDRPTLCNITHHSYFNLAGHASGPITGQELEIAADFYTPAGADLLITGEVLKLAGTPFDFRTPKPIGRDFARLPADVGAGGYDHNFCIRGEPGRLRWAATVRDLASGRGFRLWTTEPGLHLYTGGYLNGSDAGKDGVRYGQFAGFTLETQRFPDAPNLSHVPQARLDPGDVYEHIVELRPL